MKLFNKNSTTIVKSLLVLTITNFLLIGCADDQARARLADTEIRVSQLEQNVGVLNNKVANQKLVDLMNKLDDLQSQIDQLNGAVASLQHNQQSFQDTQAQLNQNIEQKLESSLALSQATNGQSDNNERSQLVSSVKKIKAHNFSVAIKQLNTLITQSKNADVVADASYYLTIAYAADGQYKNAIWIARKFIDENPKSPNAPDVLFTLYLSQQQLGMKKSAASTAEILKKSYPESAATKKLLK